MLRGVLLVAWRDFIAVVRTKGFIIGLVFLPGVIAVSALIPKLWERFAEVGERRFVVADFTGQLGPVLAEQVAKGNEKPGEKIKIRFEPYDVASPKSGATRPFAETTQELELELARRARAEEIYGFVLIGPRVLEIPAQAEQEARYDDDGDRRRSVGGDAKAPMGEDDVLYGARSLTAGDVRQRVRDAVFTAVRTLRLASVNVDVGLVRRIDDQPAVKQRLIGKREGEVVASSGASDSVTAFGVVFLILMGVMQSAGMLLNSTIEEKSNRVVEVLVSSIRPFELLAGKILGAWLTGLVVLVAWGAAGFFAANSHGFVRASMFSGPNLLWFLYFFLAGYLLFASLYAAVGAMCSSIQDAQSLMFPIIVLIMIPMLSLAPVMQHPDSVLSKILTWFPFSAPFIASLRLALSPAPPVWEIAVAAVSVAIGAWFLMWAGGKVFRIAIFSTGKPPRLGEIWRWVREA